MLSSAGLAAGIDLCLHLIRARPRAAVANRAARQCVVPPWREGGQAQFIEQPVPISECRRPPPRTREWALRQLDQRLDVAALAAHAQLSVRTFNRRFRLETGWHRAPGCSTQRVDRARMLLETTDLAVDDGGRPGRARHRGVACASTCARWSGSPPATTGAPSAAPSSTGQDFRRVVLASMTSEEPIPVSQMSLAKPAPASVGSSFSSCSPGVRTYMPSSVIE